MVQETAKILLFNYVFLQHLFFKNDAHKYLQLQKQRNGNYHSSLKSMILTYIEHDILKLIETLFKSKFNHSHPNPGRRVKSNLNFYFHTSLWSLKRFYEGFKGLHKTF